MNFGELAILNSYWACGLGNGYSGYFEKFFWACGIVNFNSYRSTGLVGLGTLIVIDLLGLKACEL